LGENWPFSPQEFNWEQGKGLENARQVLSHLITLLETGRGDEVLVDPSTGKPFITNSGVSCATPPNKALQLTARQHASQVTFFRSA
jgi:hypothetical protein